MRYFDHDVDAAKDELVQALRLECGGAAVDAYWAILELIYKDETDLVLSANRPLTKSVTHWLCTDWETLKNEFSTMAEIGLISVAENPEGVFTLHSERASRNIAAYQKRAETARQNGNKGGRKPRANQVGTKSVSKKNPRPTQGLAKEKEKEKVLVTHKGLPNTLASHDACGVEDHAPREAGCPDCSSPLKFVPGSWDTADQWWCDKCRSMKDAS